MMRYPLLVLSLATLAACGGDAKDDTSSSGGGSADDATADNDGDGLTNGEEADMGTDPDAADSDGDGTSDPDEIDAGTNPKFIWSHPYAEGDYLVGNCPVFPDEANSGPTGRGAVSGGGTWDAYQEGDIMHNLGVGGHDSFNQETPVYSFCGNYTMVVQSAEWCGPCQQLASGMPDEIETIRAEVPNFTFYEVLYQNNRGSNPNARTLGNWRDNFGLDGVPVVAPADNTAAEMNWINASGGIPATLLLAPDMTVIWSGINHPGEYYLVDARDILRAIRQYENGQ